MSTQENGYRNKLNTICNRQRWEFKKGDCTQSGPQHQSMWTGHVFVKGKAFEGKGPSMGAAWEEASKKALEYIKAENPGVVLED